MKTAIIRTASFILAGFLFFGATAYKPAERSSIPEETYYGYWVAKSGEEFTIMSDAVIPSDAYVKDAKGEFKSINRDMVAGALHVDKRTSVNGKQIDDSFLALTKVELDRSFKTVSPTTNKERPLLTTRDLQAAYMYCTTGYAAGWSGKNPCAGGTSYCTAVKLATGESIVIMCSSN